MTYKVFGPFLLCLTACALTLVANTGLLGTRAKTYFRGHLITFLLGVAYFFFAPTSITCFAFWRCDENFEPSYGGGRYLVVDYSLDCESDRYDDFYGIAVFGALFYAGAIPLGMLLLVYIDRDVLVKDVDERTEDEAARVAKSKFLWGSYTTKAWWRCRVRVGV